MTEISLIALPDVSLAGLPKTFIKGNADALNEPDAIIIDYNEPEVLGNLDIGSEFELNDFRVVVRGIVDMKPNSMASPVVFMKESDFLRKVPRFRKSVSFILATPMLGADIRAVCNEINKNSPELKAMPQSDFMRETVIWYVYNTFFHRYF